MESSPGAVPIIRRARGYRLYDHRGARYLDLSRDGGGALLGHRPGTTVALMKGVLSQGLAGALPSVWEARLVRLIASLFPSYGAVRLFCSRARACEAVSRFLGMRVEPGDLHDPAVHEATRGEARASLWRPFLDAEPDPSARRPLLPVLPFSICGAPAPVCFPEEPALDPHSDPLPGVLLAGAFSALTQLAGAASRPIEVSARVGKALDGAAGWARRGPYVRATFPAADYPRVFSEFLRAGVLLSPGYPGPSILPGECSPGETRLLVELFTSIPGG